MMTLENYFSMGAVLVASLGAASDLHSARIPNWLTYSGLAAALAVRFGSAGWTGLASGFQGMLVAGALFFLLFMIGAMGGGDTKLMAAIGAWSGQERVVAVVIAAALAGGVLAIISMILRPGFRKVMRNLAEIIRFRLTSGLSPHPDLNVSQPGAHRVPFGVAIAMGTLISAGNTFWWR